MLVLIMRHQIQPELRFWHQDSSMGPEGMYPGAMGMQGMGAMGEQAMMQGLPFHGAAFPAPSSTGVMARLCETTAAAHHKAAKHGILAGVVQRGRASHAHACTGVTTVIKPQAVAAA